MITGSLVALVTPMLEDGSIDFDAYRALIDWHVEQGNGCDCRRRYQWRIANGVC